MPTLFGIPLGWELYSPTIIVLAGTTLVVLERFFPYEPRQKLLRVGFWDDFIGYTFVHAYLLGILIKWIIEWLDSTTGVSRLHLVSGWPVWAQLAFFWVTHDFYIYWFHRLQHKNRYLWRTHEAHHSGRDVDWLSGSRSHALEILINQTIEYAPIALLGADPDIALMKGALDAVWGMFIHSNVDVHLGWLQRILNGPEMHRWHHARERVRPHGINFATKIAVWDWLFGTAYLPDRKPQSYGLYDDEPFPEGYLVQHIYAFRPFRPALEPSAAEAHPAEAE